MFRFIRLLFLICLLPISGYATNFVEGTDYKTISVANNVFAPSKGKVTVVEFFSPGCPWCFKLQPALEAWLKTKPSYVTFSRNPVAFEAGWDAYQKAYLIAVALEKEPIILPALFKAIQVDNANLASEDALANFFAQYGVKPTTFHQLYNAPSIDLERDQANKLMTTYKIYQIPTLLINGKYVLSSSMAKGDDKRMIQILNYLVTKTHS